MDGKKVYFYFKLFNNIKDECEAANFARIELETLFGKVTGIANFSDYLSKKPLSLFVGNSIRIQDIITHELPYGKIHGYYGTKDKVFDVTPLVKRLAYTREIFVIVKSHKSKELLNKIFPDHALGKNSQYFKFQKWTLYRFITNQFFLEKSEYISKLSRNEYEVERNVNYLFEYLINQVYRIPASSTLSIGKRLQDYFAIREEPSLYITHYMHGYKGKFHPKMVRAILNYIYPENKGVVMDNFSGSGTLLVEAAFLGLDSRGVEINPLSALMSNVKCCSLKIPIKELRKQIKTFLQLLKTNIEFIAEDSAQRHLKLKETIDLKKIRTGRERIPESIIQQFNNRKLKAVNSNISIIDKILITQEVINRMNISDKGKAVIRDFLLLALSGTISDIARRTTAEFTTVLEDRLNDLYLRIYLFARLNEVLKINLGHSVTFVMDTKNMKREISPNSIDGIVNSPPYSTALDYIKNDRPQLTILNMVKSMEELEWNMMGNPRRKNYNRDDMLMKIQEEDKKFLRLPKYAKHTILMLLNGERDDAALRTFKFWDDMYETMKEMFRVLKRGKKCAIIIGNNFYKLGEEYVEIENDKVIKEIGERLSENKKKCFKVDRVIKRKLEKTSVGNIRTESIIILEKP